MDKEQLKKDIQSLINDFRANYNQYKKELEANTETKLVEPLFALLGWTKNDFVKRETTRRGIKKGFADYAFKIDGRIAFFLEVKKVGIPLEKEADKQVISYALSKRIPFAVSTNFEELKIFCVEQENATTQIFRVFKKPEDYISNLQNLMLLSKESFEKNLILKEAENEGRLKKRMSIDKILLDDLMHIRKLIADDIEKTYPKKYEVNDKEEIVQRVIDRLIFIRRCEDVGMNPENMYLEEIKHLPDNKAYPKLKEIFEEYNRRYNSGLFTVGKDNDCDTIKIDGLIIKKLIGYLYESKDGQYIYNFDWIDADVLGQVYEQYLGKILEQTKSGKARLKDGQAHRKEQGIYYTPAYIVDYIVKNTLGELLKDKKINVEDIKILDPACGSGSFLIKAFDYLYENLLSKDNIKQHKIDSQGMYSIKTEILKRNIYGVDLDNKAVEITKLNLLLKAAEKDRKLPEEVDLHIKHGNSLIDDENIDKNAFKWAGDFQEGSFDVIIGNPPYIRIQTLDKKEVEYYNRKYESPEKNYDIYMLFIEKGFNLLKNDGVLGLILPHKFFQGENGQNIRKFIKKNNALHKIVDFGTNQIFENAATYTCLLFLQKKKNKEFYYKKFGLGEDYKNLTKLAFDKKDPELLKEDKWNFSGDEVQKVLMKIKSQKSNFESITKKIFKGSSTGNDKIFLLDLIKTGKSTSRVFSTQLNQEIELENNLLHPFVHGEDIRRYAPIKSNKILLFPYTSGNNGIELVSIEDLRTKYPNTFEYLSNLKKELLKRKVELNNNNFYKYSAARSLSEYTQPKIMIPDMLVSNRVGYDEQGLFYHGPAIHSVVFNDEIKKWNAHFYLGVLNSKLFWFFISNTSTALRGDAYRLTPEFLNPFCFPKLDLNNKTIIDGYNKLNNLVIQMLSLNKKLNELGDKNTSETAKLKEEIKKTDDEINEEVYKFYSITDKEKEIIEESLK